MKSLVVEELWPAWYRVVLLEGGRLESPANCQLFGMLKADVALSQDEKAIFSDLGCLIAKDSRGKFVEVAPSALPLLSALAGAASRRCVQRSNFFTSAVSAEVSL